MAKTTKIQWCDSTVNPVMGCEGCELWTATTKACYAGNLHRLRRNHKGFASQFEVPETFPGRMHDASKANDLAETDRTEKPWLDGLPRLIFVSDMGDALSQSIGFEYLRYEIIQTAESEKGRRHRWLWLTKRPGRMSQFSDWLSNRGQKWPANLWAGTSVTGPDSYGRAKELLSVGNDRTTRFLSVESQLAAVDLTTGIGEYDWVIQGGESSVRGKARPFHLEWAKDLLDACRAAEVAYFLKQLGSDVRHEGERLTLDDGHGGDWAEWPEHLRVRQMPDCS